MSQDKIVSLVGELKPIAPTWAKRIKQYGIGTELTDRFREIIDDSSCIVGEAHKWRRDYASHVLPNPNYCKQCDNASLYNYCKQCDNASLYILANRGGLSMSGLKRFIRHWKHAHAGQNKE